MLFFFNNSTAHFSSALISDLFIVVMYRHEDYVDAIRWINEGKIQLKPLMSKHFAFEDYLAAYDYIDHNQEATMKVLIDVDATEE